MKAKRLQARKGFEWIPISPGKWEQRRINPAADAEYLARFALEGKAQVEHENEKLRSEAIDKLLAAPNARVKPPQWSSIMTKGKLAGKLGVSEETLNKMNGEGKIHLEEISRQQWRLDLSTLDETARLEFARQKTHPSLTRHSAQTGRKS